MHCPNGSPTCPSLGLVTSSAGQERTELHKAQHHYGFSSLVTDEGPESQGGRKSVSFLQDERNKMPFPTRARGKQGVREGQRGPEEGKEERSGGKE